MAPRAVPLQFCATECMRASSQITCSDPVMACTAAAGAVVTLVVVAFCATVIQTRGPTLEKLDEIPAGPRQNGVWLHPKVFEHVQAVAQRMRRADTRIEKEDANEEKRAARAESALHLHLKGKDEKSLWKSLHSSVDCTKLLLFSSGLWRGYGRKECGAWGCSPL